MQISFLCKQNRDLRNMTNQDIADRAGLPLSTVSYFFSAASKAPSVYTAGVICAAVGLSLDRYFKISPYDPEKEAQLLDQKYIDQFLKAEQAHIHEIEEITQKYSRQIKSMELQQAEREFIELDHELQQAKQDMLHAQELAELARQENSQLRRINRGLLAALCTLGLCFLTILISNSI